MDFAEFEAESTRNVTNVIFKQYQGRLESINEFQIKVEKEIIAPVVVRLKDCHSSCDTLYNALDSSMRAYLLILANLRIKCVEYENAFLDLRTLKNQLSDIQSKKHDNKFDLELVESLSEQINLLASPYESKKKLLEHKQSEMVDHLNVVNEKWFQLESAWSNYTNYTVDSHFKLAELVKFVFEKYNQVTADRPLLPVLQLSEETLHTYLASFNPESDFVIMLSYLDNECKSSVDLSKLDFFKGLLLNEISKVQIQELVDRHLKNKIKSINSQTVDPQNLNLDEFNEHEILNHTQSSLQLIQTILAFETSYDLSQLQELEKVCNNYDNVANILKELTAIYYLNIYGVAHIAPVQVHTEKYFVLTHTAVLCSNYLKKAVETFGLKPKYVELLFELLTVCNIFYKLSDGTRVKLLKSLQSEMFNQAQIWIALVDFDIDMQISYYEEKKRRKSKQSMFKALQNNFASLFDEKKKLPYTNVIISRLTFWLKYMVDIEVNSDVINHLVGYSVLKRKLDYDKTLGILCEVRNYEKAQYVDSSHKLCKWDSRVGKLKNVFEKLVNHGFILSKSEQEFKINKTVSFHFDREHFKFLLRNVNECDKKAAIIHEILKKNLQNESYSGLIERVHLAEGRRQENKYKFLEVIDMDVERTYNGTRHFQNYDKWEMEAIHKKLQRILYAYSMKNANIGYCQGMNYLASFCLILMEFDEEKSFQLFAAVIDHLKIEPLYDSKMEYLKTQFYLTDRLIAIYLNKVYKTLYAPHVSSALWISPYVITLFCNLLHNNICGFDTVVSVFENVLIDKWIGINKNLLLICRDVCANYMEKPDYEQDEQEFLVQKFFEVKDTRLFADRDGYLMQYDSIDVDVVMMRQLEEEYREIKKSADSYSKDK